MQPRSLLHLDPGEVAILRQPGGQALVRFVNALLFAELAGRGLPATALKTTERTDVPDGGVDAELGVAVAGSPTDWLRAPTLWQFRAQRHSRVRLPALRGEFRKPEVRKRIARGFAYRFCIADEVPPKKQAEWEAALQEEVKRIAPDAPAPRVITAEHLAEWSARFPSVVLHHFRRGTASGFLCFETWRGSMTSLTPHYVPVANWEEARSRLRRHIRFEEPGDDPVLALSGDAGVGKTRLVHEVLQECPEARSLTLYAPDERVIYELACELASARGRSGILVVDGCDLSHQQRLRDVLAGCRNRVRAIALDHGRVVAPTGSDPMYLRKIPEGVVQEILLRNFSDCPEQQRALAVELAGGFVRLAVELCRSPWCPATPGQALSHTEAIGRYFHSRFDPWDRDVIAALSLFMRVGFREKVAGELAAVTALTCMDPSDLSQRAARLHDTAGLVGRGGRYLYVTPEVVAEVAFADAWRRWAEADPDAFLRRIPENLLPQFLARVARSGSEEVRRCVGDCFLEWAHQRSPTDLACSVTTRRLRTLTEIQPDHYLEAVRRLVEATTPAAFGHPDARPNLESLRPLVGLVQRLAAFPPYFEPAEAILFHISATLELGPDWDTGARRTWTTLFSVYHSGTGVPFAQRIALLRRRLEQGSVPERALALTALEQMLDGPGFRVLSSPLVAGMVQPDDWRPRSAEEHHECWAEVVDALVTTTWATPDELADRATEILLRRLYTLLPAGHLRVLQEAFPPDRVTDALRPRLLQQGEFALDALARHSHPCTETTEAVSAWMASLAPDSLHDQLVIAVGQSQWDHAGRPETEVEFVRIAEILIARPVQLEQELPYLCSPAAQAANLLGWRMGELDPEGVALAPIMASTEATDRPALACGYLAGLLKGNPDAGSTVNAWLDELTPRAPRLVHELALAGGDAVHALTRTLALVDTERIPADCAANLRYGVGDRKLTPDELGEVLRRLLPPTAAGGRPLLQRAFECIRITTGFSREETERFLAASPHLLDLTYELVETPTEPRLRDDYLWAEILIPVVLADPARGISAACRLLTSTDSARRKAAASGLAQLGIRLPDEVMEAVGGTLLRTAEEWPLLDAGVRSVLACLPPEVASRGVARAGLPGARALARFLPEPELDAEQLPHLSPITEAVLIEFGQDPDVRDAFVVGPCAVVVTFSGSAADFAEGKAAHCRKFLNHPLPAVQAWALHHLKSSREHAKRWRRREAEWEVPTG